MNLLPLIFNDSCNFSYARSLHPFAQFFVIDSISLWCRHFLIPKLTHPGIIADPSTLEFTPNEVDQKELLREDTVEKAYNTVDEKGIEAVVLNSVSKFSKVLFLS